MVAEQRVIFIVGQTASGKSALAMKLAKQLNGEIVAADSQTIRRGLDIGTAKPTLEDQQAVPHHMIDIVDPYEPFNVAMFKQQAMAAIQDIQARGKQPLVVGGTGLYIDALFYDYAIDDGEQATDDLDEKSVSELQAMIKAAGYDLPDNAQNPRHLIGVLRREGKSPKNQLPMTGAIMVGILRDEELLKTRIDQRVEAMFAGEFVDEVKAVIEKYGRPPKKMDAIGYPIALRYLDGEVSLDEAKELFKRGDWQYARRQKAWFKRNEHIRWFTEVDAAFEYSINLLTN